MLPAGSRASGASRRPRQPESPPARAGHHLDAGRGAPASALLLHAVVRIPDDRRDGGGEPGSRRAPYHLGRSFGRRSCGAGEHDLRHNPGVARSWHRLAPDAALGAGCFGAVGTGGLVDRRGNGRGAARYCGSTGRGAGGSASLCARRRGPLALKRERFEKRVRGRTRRRARPSPVSLVAALGMAQLALTARIQPDI